MNGYCFYVFEIEQKGENYDHLLPLYKSGNLRLVIKFKDNIANEPVQMLVHGSFPYKLLLVKETGKKTPTHS